MSRDEELFELNKLQAEVRKRQEQRRAEEERLQAYARGDHPTEVFQTNVTQPEKQQEPGLISQALATIIASIPLAFVGTLWAKLIVTIVVWTWGLFG